MRWDVEGVSSRLHRWRRPCVPAQRAGRWTVSPGRRATSATRWCALQGEVSTAAEVRGRARGRRRRVALELCLAADTLARLVAGDDEFCALWPRRDRDVVKSTSPRACVGACVGR
ncbi:hypothetical protein SETIT_9G027900v2 [Setaria italica]|uniref:Uncharacterized protein n=1 Tax=Setaria italica TaxID=4555 RepID=A0A368SE88_SETIT|nr:hypothetical protein SETIT_9G027900v2 [Setaria italica]